MIPNVTNDEELGFFLANVTEDEALKLVVKLMDKFRWYGYWADRNAARQAVLDVLDEIPGYNVSAVQVQLEQIITDVQADWRYTGCGEVFQEMTLNALQDAAEEALQEFFKRNDLKFTPEEPTELPHFVSLDRLVREARDLRTEPDDTNEEYDRALVELVLRSAGLSDDDRPRIEKLVLEDS